MRKALVLLTAVATLVACGADEDDPAVIRAGAEQACQEWVTDRLKAPSTAEFVDVYATKGQADLTEQDIYDGKLDESVYTVKGSVDSQNGFGAMLRTGWTCEVKLDAEGENWTLLGLDME